MKSQRSTTAFPSVMVLGFMATLAGALGASLGGLRGMQGGCIAGIVLALLPFLGDRAGRWLTRQDGLPRFVLQEIGRIISSSLAPALRGIAAPFAFIGRTLHGPLVLLLLVISVTGNLVGMAIDTVARSFATPLGIANLAAVAVIVIDLRGFSFSPLAILVGLFALVLTLLVSLSEAETI